MASGNHSQRQVKSLSITSLSPEYIFTRVLTNYKQIQLSDQQIRKLLDVHLSYTRNFHNLMTRFANVRHQIETSYNGQITNKKEKKIKLSISKRGKIFMQHEMLFIIALKELKKVLSSKQQHKLEEIYINERRKIYRQIYNPLRYTLKPAYQLRNVSRHKKG